MHPSSQILGGSTERKQRALDRRRRSLPQGNSRHGWAPALAGKSRPPIPVRQVHRSFVARYQRISAVGNEVMRRVLKQVAHAPVKTKGQQISDTVSASPDGLG